MNTLPPALLCFPLPGCAVLLPPAPSWSLTQPSCAPSQPLSSQRHRSKAPSLPQAHNPDSVFSLSGASQPEGEGRHGEWSVDQVHNPPVLCRWLMVTAGVAGQGRGLGRVPTAVGSCRTLSISSWPQDTDSARHPLLPIPYRCFKLHRENSASLLLRPVLNQFN